MKTLKKTVMTSNFRFCMHTVMLGLALIIANRASAQQSAKDRQEESLSFMHKAEAAKKDGDFARAEANYRRALAKNMKNADASYNMGHLYSDNKKEIEAMKNLLQTAKHAGSKSLKHMAYHNLGNAYMDQKDYQQAVKAYEDALRNDPSDDQTRYNLAVAKEKLEKQQKQNKKNKKNKDKNKKNKDKNKKNKNKSKSDKDKKKKDKKNKSKKKDRKDKDKGKDKQQKKNKEGDDKKKQDQKSKGDKQKQKKQKAKSKPEKGKLSKQQAKSLLRAARNLEKKVQEKRQKKKKKRAPDQPVEKDW